MQKKKIVYVIHNLEVGGAEKMLTVLSRYMSNYFSVYVVTILKNDPNNKIFLLDSKVKLIALNQQSLKNLKISFLLFSIFRDIKPDIVHTHLIYSLIHSCVAYLGCFWKMKRLHTVHGMTTIEAPTPLRHYFYWVAFFLKVRLISISNAVKKSINKDYHMGSVMIYNGVEECSSTPGLDFKTQSIILSIKEKFQVVYVTVGRAHKIKNHLELFKAFSELRIESHSIALIHVGRIENDEYGKDLRKCILDNIFTLGEQDNIDAIMQEVDRFIIVSHSEGLGLVAVEAQKNGLPIISTKNDGLQEVVIDNHNGLFTKDTTSQSIKDAILIMEGKSNSQIKNMKESAKKHFSQNFTLKQCVKKYYDLYCHSI